MLRHPLRASLILAFHVGALASVTAAGCADDEESNPATLTVDSGADSTSPADGSTTPDGGGTSDAQATDAATDSPALDAPADSPIAPSGPYALVYSGRLNGIDRRIVLATLATGGGATGYEWTTNPTSEAPYLGTAQIAEPANDAFFSIGRWTNGTVLGPFYDDAGVKTLTDKQGQHQGYALQGTPSLPASGTASYTLLAATKPTAAVGSLVPGTLTAATAQVVFGGATSSRAGVSIQFSMTNGDWNLTANGGSSAVGDAGVLDDYPPDAGFFGGSIPVATTTTSSECGDGGVCPPGNMQFWFAGPNAERLIVAFVVGGPATGGDRRGLAVLSKQ